MRPVVQTNLSAIPKNLAERYQWVCWRYARPNSSNQHRWCKVPISPNSGKPAKVTIPSSWSDLGSAIACVEENDSNLDGIGFVFTDDDPFVGIDLDNCFDMNSGSMTPWAQLLVDELDSYTEVSPSGTGVKCILRSSKKVLGRRKSSPGIEIYSSGRFFTITGDQIGNQPEPVDRTEQILKVHAEHFPISGSRGSTATSQRPNIPTTPDSQVIKSAISARNGAKFRDLMLGRLSYHQDNHSEADLGLCRILAFWCGPNPSQIDRLFRKSKLFREKWDQPHFANGTTYGQATVQRAILAQDGTFFRWKLGKK